jgi:hypothetical protein
MLVIIIISRDNIARGMVRDRHKSTLLIHQKYAFVLFFTGFTLPPNHILPQIAIWLPVHFVF